MAAGDGAWSVEVEARGGGRGGMTGRGGGSSRLPDRDTAAGGALGWGTLGAGAAAGGGRDSGVCRGCRDMFLGGGWLLRCGRGANAASAMISRSMRAPVAAFLTFYSFSSAEFGAKLSTMTRYQTGKSCFAKNMLNNLSWPIIGNKKY